MYVNSLPKIDEPKSPARRDTVSRSVPLKEVKRSLSKRTKMDKKRKHSPLKKVKDAILIKTDLLNKKEVLKKMSLLINEFLKNSKESLQN